MPCNCKANSQILALGKKYGTTVNPTRKDLLKAGIWKWIQYIFLGIFAILAAPVLFFIIIYKVAVKKENVIHIDKIVGLNRS